MRYLSLVFKIIFEIALYIFFSSIFGGYMHKETKDGAVALFYAATWPLTLPMWIGAGIGRDIYNSCHMKKE